MIPRLQNADLLRRPDGLRSYDRGDLLPSAPVTGEADPRRPVKILIVDDEPGIVEYLKQELGHVGYETLTAGNGEEALEKVANESPDLILLDVIMPGVDGFTVCRTLKANTETRRTPVVIMTALDGIEDRVRGIEAGADHFLTKPFNRRELLARIQTLLKLKWSTDREIRDLRSINDHFAKFVPAGVRRIIAANPGAPELAPRQQDISVLFVDISGYARLSDTLPPEALHSLVERYFSAYLDRIWEAGGDMTEAAGDGFMAIFQDADPQRHAVTAVDTALALLADTETLNRESSEPPLAIHMGINSGLALVGSTRFQSLRGSRWSFTASGSATNLAARLAGAAAAGQILAGAATVRRLGNRYRLEALGREHLKNFVEPIELHRVLGPSLDR